MDLKSRLCLRSGLGFGLRYLKLGLGKEEFFLFNDALVRIRVKDSVSVGMDVVLAINTIDGNG